MIRPVVFVALFAFASASALAQTTPAAKPAAKVAHAKKAVVAEKPLPAADPAQIDAAERVFYGPYDCEFKQTLDVSINPKYPGYADVTFQKKLYVTKPVLSSTGALRLEDVKGVALVIQIANKSMLMDVKAGHRLVDNCIHEKQRTANGAAGK